MEIKKKKKNQLLIVRESIAQFINSPQPEGNQNKQVMYCYQQFPQLSPELFLKCQEDENQEEPGSISYDE